MMSSKIQDIDWSLYVIVDADWIHERSVIELTELVIQGGAGVIQYRDKKSSTEDFYSNAAELRELTHHYSLPFIVNDRVDIAVAVGADGIHLGQQDIHIDKARKLADSDMIFGGSVSNEKEYLNIQQADYFGIGAVYPTNTKQDAEPVSIELIRKIRSLTDKPLIGIGGITPENLSPVIQAGCDGVAVISAVLGHDDLKQAAEVLLDKVREAKSIDINS